MRRKLPLSDPPCGRIWPIRFIPYRQLRNSYGSKDGQTISHGALGKYLAKNADKVTGGLRLERAGEFRRAMCWRVRNLEEKGKQEIETRTQKTHTNSQNSHDPHNAVDRESVSIVSFDEFPPASFPNHAKRNFAPGSPNDTDNEGNWESLLQSAPPTPDEADNDPIPF